MLPVPYRRCFSIRGPMGDPGTDTLPAPDGRQGAVRGTPSEMSAADGKRKRKTKQKKPPPLPTRETLDRAALRYLERFDSSAANLRRVLAGHVRRAARAHSELDVPAAERLVDELIERYLASGLLDDARYAESLARGLRGRGASRRGIQHKLRARGVDAEAIDEAIASAGRDSDDAELDAARAFVRRRRLGPHRPEPERAERYQRDLAALARAGFSFEVARRALAIPEGAADDVF